MATGTPLACIQMFRDIAMGKAKDENFVFSPSSMQLGLSLVANGAKGSTLQVLLKFLQVDCKTELKSRAAQLISALTEGDDREGPKLSFVGGIWVDHSQKITENFKIEAENIYKAKAESVDFKNNAEEILMAVNQWAAESTNGLIDSLLPEKSINENTIVVLANALYFQDMWSNPFAKKLTEDFEFYMLGEDTVKVPFMSNYFDTKYIKTFHDVNVLRLPYEMSSFSMYILLPHAKDGLFPLLEKVASDSFVLDQYVSSVTKSVLVGKFGIPKFKINYKFEASEVLQALGLGLCFSDEAEFNDIGRGKVQAVYHGSHIEVDEDGTKAAASTVIEMESEDEECDPDMDLSVAPVDFVADHPFMYIVKDDTSGMIMFMGHVVNPLL